MNFVLINREAAGQSLQVLFSFFTEFKSPPTHDSDFMHAGGPLKWKSFNAAPDKYGAGRKKAGKTTPLKHLD